MLLLNISVWGHTIGTHKLAVVRVNYADQQSTCTTTQDAQNILIKPSSHNTSHYDVKTIIEKSSNGRFIVDSNVGVFTLYLNDFNTTTDSQYNRQLSIFKERAIAAGINLNQYDHIAFILPSGTSIFQPGVGGVAVGNDSVLRLCSPGAVAHELMHSLGLNHASMLNFTSGNLIEYGDRSSIMGPHSTGAEIKAHSKAILNWLAGREKVFNIPTGNGSQIIELYSSDVTTNELPICTNEETGQIGKEHCIQSIVVKGAVDLRDTFLSLRKNRMKKDNGSLVNTIIPIFIDNISIHRTPSPNTLGVVRDHEVLERILCQPGATSCDSTYSSYANGNYVSPFNDNVNKFTVKYLSFDGRKARIKITWSDSCIKRTPTISGNGLAHHRLNPEYTLPFSIGIKNKDIGNCPPRVFNHQINSRHVQAGLSPINGSTYTLRAHEAKTIERFDFITGTASEVWPFEFSISDNSGYTFTQQASIANYRNFNIILPENRDIHIFEGDTYQTQIELTRPSLLNFNINLSSYYLNQTEDDLIVSNFAGNVGDTSIPLSVTAIDDVINEDIETYRISFGTPSVWVFNTSDLFNFKFHIHEKEEIPVFIEIDHIIMKPKLYWPSYPGATQYKIAATNDLEAGVWTTFQTFSAAHEAGKLHSLAINFTSNVQYFKVVPLP